MLSRPFNSPVRAPKKDAMKRSALAPLALAVALALVGSACSSRSSNAKAPATTSTLKPRDVGAAIAYDPRLSTFATALNSSGVLGRLAGQRVTVFAPDNAAFARIPHATLVALLTSRADGRLARFIRGHIVRGAIPQSALESKRVKTIDGQPLTIKKSADGVTVSDGHGHTAAVEVPPINAANAVIYPIKSVLSPAAAR